MKVHLHVADATCPQRAKRALSNRIPALQSELLSSLCGITATKSGSRSVRRGKGRGATLQIGPIIIAIIDCILHAPLYNHVSSHYKDNKKARAMADIINIDEHEKSDKKNKHIIVGFSANRTELAELQGGLEVTLNEDGHNVFIFYRSILGIDCETDNQITGASRITILTHEGALTLYGRHLKDAMTLLRHTDVNIKPGKLGCGEAVMEHATWEYHTDAFMQFYRQQQKELLPV